MNFIIGFALFCLIAAKPRETDLFFGNFYDGPRNIETNTNGFRQKFEDRQFHDQKISKKMCDDLNGSYDTILFQSEKTKISTKLVLQVDCETFEGIINISNAIFTKKYTFNKNQIKTDKGKVGLLIFTESFILRGQMATPYALSRAYIRTDNGSVYGSSVMFKKK